MMTMMKQQTIAATVQRNRQREQRITKRNQTVLFMYKFAVYRTAIY